MKNRVIYLIALLTIPFTSCESQTTNQEYSSTPDSDTAENEYVETADSRSEMTMYPVRSPKMQVATTYLPLPGSWKVVGPRGTGQEYITGPNGIKVTALPAQNFAYDVDGATAQFMQRNGQQIAQPASAKTITNSNLKSQIEQQGGRLIRDYPLSKMMPKVIEESQFTSNAYGLQFQSVEMHASEWEQKNGNKSLIIVSTTRIRTGNGLSMWSLDMEEMEAPASEFEGAKDTFLNSLFNSKMDRQAIASHGQRQLQQHQAKMAQNQANARARSQASFQAHQQRMAQNQASFQATQKAHVDASNSISDMQMQTYRNNSASFDRTQQGAVNAVWGENTVTNPHTGEQMQVQHGYNRTFVDPDGNYIQTDDMFINPQYQQGFENYQEIDW